MSVLGLKPDNVQFYRTTPRRIVHALLNSDEEMPLGGCCVCGESGKSLGHGTLILNLVQSEGNRDL